jgi:thiosulfate reductase / polysulfide reductase chain A
MPVNTIYSVCGMCPVRCPIEVDVENGECRFIQGNRQVPSIRGALCTRGGAGIPFVRDDERPQFPMLRKGGRGEGRWQRLSWEEALAQAAEKLTAVRSNYGGRSVLWSDTGGPFSDLRQAFVRGLGSPNYFSAESVQGVNRQHAALSLFGFSDDQLVLDLKNAREVVLQARNLFESVHIQQANDLLDGLANGGRLTVVDTRATVTSGKADRFFLIRPGTDYALNMAVIHVLLERKLYDAAYAEKWIADLDELGRMTAGFSPEVAEAETGIPAADIEALTQALAKAAPKVVWHPGWKTSRYTDSFFVCRTAFIINALLGAVGARGGLPLAARPEDVGQKGLNRFGDLLPSVTEQRADGVGWKYPAFEGGPGLLHSALSAIPANDPYPIKALVTYQQDPLAELPDPQKLTAILAGLDFLACITSAWSETAWQADLVLPLSSYLERESLIAQLDGVKPAFLLRRRCASPRFDTRADWEIVGGLARRLGMESLAFTSPEDIWKFQLNGTGVRLQDFDAKGMVDLTGQPNYGRLAAGFRFPTDSGKIEIVSFRWRRQGLPSLGPLAPRGRPAAGTFRLTLGGCGLHDEGHTVNNPLLHKQMAENVLWLNQDAAAALGIKDGETVGVSVQDRSGRIKVRLSEFIHPEAAFTVPGFGRSLPPESRALGRGLAANRLMPGGLDIQDHSGGGLALQEHVITVRKL